MTEIKTIDVRTASDGEYEALNRFQNRLKLERMPDDPPTPLAEEVAGFRNLPEVRSLSVFVIWEGSSREIAAKGSVSFWQVEENKHVVDFHVEVVPELRRRGLARQLMHAMVEIPVRENRTLMIGQTNARVPAGENFLERVGARRGLDEHTNQLDLNDLNRDLLAEWLARSPERASGFDLGFWEGEYPEEVLDDVCRLIEIMNTAPRGDLQVEDFKLKPEHLRQWERADRSRGTERWTAYVRERATGKIAGFTDVFWNPNRPHLLGQGGTGVMPEFRNLGLGRWLKAAMMERVLRGRPTVRLVRTGNADSNAPMLKINYEMGFKPYLSECVWQVETDRVLEYLKASA